MMENKLFKYIEFLLPQYNCVIIPDFGGFIVNIEPAHIDEDGTIAPPTYRISFNQDLKHNDGLLASHIQQKEEMSYETACLTIKKYVEEIKKDCAQKGFLSCEKLGQLTADESGNLSFIPNQSNVHPQLIGLSSVHLPLLSQIDHDIRREKRNISLKYTIGTVAAAAAAILLLIGPSVKIGSITDTKDRQQANFVHTLVQRQSKAQVANTVQFEAAKNRIIAMPEKKAVTANAIQESSIRTTPLKNIDNTSNVAHSSLPDSFDISEENVRTSRTYYIIVGGEETKEQANRLLAKIQSEEFPAANIVESADRFRIYVKAFEDKTKAEGYLEKFRKENPRHKAAWLFSMRNR